MPCRSRQPICWSIDRGDQKWPTIISERRPGATDTSPLLLLFHGTGGDENQFFDLGPQLLPGARIVAPRGDVSEHGALRYFRRTGEGVYDMDDLRLRTAQMADFVRARIAETQPSKVIGLGYSNGANILASVQFAAPELFDATVLMHPLIPFKPAAAPALRDRKVLITAGRRDPIGPADRHPGAGRLFQRRRAPRPRSSGTMAAMNCATRNCGRRRRSSPPKPGRAPASRLPRRG